MQSSKSSPKIVKNLSWNWNLFGKDGVEDNEIKVRRTSSQRPPNGPPSDFSTGSYHTICVGNIAQFKSTISSNQTQDWLSLENSIVELFNKSGEVLIPNGALVHIHQHVRNLLDSNIGSFVYDRYKSQMLRKGMSILKNKITQNIDFIEGLGETWIYFFSSILPALDCILFRVKAKCGLTIRQTSLIAFRDEIMFQIDFEEKLNDMLNEKKSIPPNIKHMLLVLQGIYECYPPSKNKIRVETLTALVVSPYLGYKGIYLNENDSEPTIPSREPHLNARRKSTDFLSRSASRPLTMQPKQLETLSLIHI